MQLIDEIEISYFRSFYKFKIRHLRDLNIIFGKNDSGKSNVVRALNMFFSGAPEHSQPFEFPIDFCERRAVEAEAEEGIRKFLYVKVTFNTPESFKKSLGEKFYVKRQWTVSRGQSYHEEISNSIPAEKRQYATRLLNKIRFIYVPAIKDVRIFELLLSAIHETVAHVPEFEAAVGTFSDRLQELTSEMFRTLPAEVSASTKIGAPTRLGQLFQTLDFETTSVGETSPKSLTRQRGDGVKARHIPELLSFISENDKYDYHVWGFEEPENSLDFVAAQSEAKRLLALACGERVQVFLTTHSPSFYLLNDERAQRLYVGKDEQGLSQPLQGRDLEKFDAQSAIGEGFYLPAVAKALEEVSRVEERAREAEASVHELRVELLEIQRPVLLTEGRTDAKIILAAWNNLRDGDPPFHVRSCETGGDNAGSGNGGASNLAIRLRGIPSDHPHPVIGLFDYDVPGIGAFALDRNFVEVKIGESTIKRGMHGKSFAACLPAPDFRAECFSHKNLPIEFLFRDEQLAAEVDGKKLPLKQKMASTKVGDQKYEMPLGNDTHFMDIGKDKVDFAEVVVPTFGKDAFIGFEPLFALLGEILKLANEIDDAQK